MDLDYRRDAAAGLRRYAALVAVALGIPEDAYTVDPDPPMQAYLAMQQRLPVFADWDVALIWDEVDGWAGAIETRALQADTGEDLIALSYLGGDVLPAPRVVNEFARALLSGEQPGQPHPPHFRDTPTPMMTSNNGSPPTPQPDNRTTEHPKSAVTALYAPRDRPPPRLRPPHVARTPLTSANVVNA